MKVGEAGGKAGPGVKQWLRAKLPGQLHSGEYVKIRGDVMLEDK